MSPSQQPTTTPRLIIHGGAGHITRTNLPPAVYHHYTTSLLNTLRSTALLLTTGASSLDAATHAITLLENNPLLNCGRGAVFTRTGTIELEASIMVSRGYRKRGVGVSLLTHVKNPILLAREILVRGEVDGGGGGNNGGGGGDPAGGAGGAQGHCQLSGRVVEELAREWGCDMVERGYFWTRKRWEEHLKGLEGEKGTEKLEGWEEKVRGEGAEGWIDDGEGDGGWDGKGYLPQGTVGCVCLDQYGTLCVATSTGGLTNKLPGRIGDTPTLGAGFWAEEWEVPKPVLYRQPDVIPPLAALLPTTVRQILADCLPSLSGYIPLSTTPSKALTPTATTRAVALSGTGNGDSFLRLSAVRTASAIARFAPSRTLASAVSQIAGPGGELQLSAGDRWNRTGEGEGGMVGIEVVRGVGEVVFDFNCGGMFRAWVDEGGRERVGVFKEEY